MNPYVFMAICFAIGILSVFVGEQLRGYKGPLPVSPIFFKLVGYFSITIAFLLFLVIITA